MLPGNLNIHPKKPRHEMQRHENRRQHRNPTHHRGDIITQPQIRRTQLRQTVRLRSPDDLVEMRQVRHGGYQMVLHVAEVEEQILPVGKRGVFVSCLAAFDEAVEDVDFAAEGADQVGDFLAEGVDAWD